MRAQKNQDEPQEPGQDWGELLDRLQRGGSESFLYTKQQRTRVRLVRKPGEPYYAELATSYQGRAKTKFMILAVDMGAADDERKVKGLILAKTPFKQIVALLTEGYDLWDLEGGYGVTIMKSGAGLETQYSVMPSQKPLAVDPALVADAPTFEELQFEYEKMQKSRATVDEDTDADGPAGDW